MKKFNWFIFTFLAFALVSCEDDEAVLDNDDPQIAIVSPTSQMEFYPDEEVMLEATVTDNLGLEAVTVYVTAPGAAEQEVLTEDVDDFLNDNTKAEIEEVITLSTGTPAAGSYVIRVVALDEAGNEATQSVTINILEADEAAPTVEVTTPEENAAYMLGEVIPIAVNVEEEKMLQEIVVELGPNGQDPLETWTISEGFTAGEPFMIDEEFTLPDDAPVGNYVLTIEATDMAGNVEPTSIPFTVSEATAGE